MPINVLSQRFVKEWSSTFGSISHPARLAILLTLYEIEHRGEGPVYFNELCKAYGMSESLMLYHLERLMNAELIEVGNADEVGPYHRIYNLQERGKKLLVDLGLDREILKAIEKRRR